MPIYDLTLAFHSLVRWIVLGLAVAVVIGSIRGWVGQIAWGKMQEKLTSLWLITMDLQLLAGLSLYFWLSPVARAARSNMKLAMHDSALRFYAVEHITLMLLAIVAMHVGRVLVRRAKSDSVKFRRATIWFGLAFVLLLCGVPWPFPFLGHPVSSF